MSAVIANALVIGGGSSGMSAAIELAKLGIEVDLVEKDPGWRSYGAGISINGSSLRALRTLGVLPQVLAQGCGSDGVDLYTADGHPIMQLPTPRLAGADVPGGAGIMRPVLARILAEQTRAAGVHVRLGCTFTSLEQRDRQVAVSFTDGRRGTYELVIGADGLNSKTRAAILPQAPAPKYSGQGVWRAVAPRPAEVLRPAMFMGARVKAGVNPVSASEMYLFVTEDRPDNRHIPDEALLPGLRALLEAFSAPLIAGVRQGLGALSQIIYRPLEPLLVPEPWFMGRIVLIGDAVHATTPHLAAGAGMGFEDGIVLAAELAAAPDLPSALQRFGRRRGPRCRLVVENSVRLGEIEQTGGSKEEHARIMRDSLAALAAPI